jgi:hypothetical protein
LSSLFVPEAITATTFIPLSVEADEGFRSHLDDHTCRRET